MAPQTSTSTVVDLDVVVTGPPQSVTELLNRIGLQVNFVFLTSFDDTLHLTWNFGVKCWNKVKFYFGLWCGSLHIPDMRTGKWWSRRHQEKTNSDLVYKHRQEPPPHPHTITNIQSSWKMSGLFGKLGNLFSIFMVVPLTVGCKTSANFLCWKLTAWESERYAMICLLSW